MLKLTTVKHSEFNPVGIEIVEKVEYSNNSDNLRSFRFIDGGGVLYDLQASEYGGSFQIRTEAPPEMETKYRLSCILDDGIEFEKFFDEEPKATDKLSDLEIKYTVTNQLIEKIETPKL